MRIQHNSKCPCSLEGECMHCDGIREDRHKLSLAQAKLWADKGLPMHPPFTGVCWGCSADLMQDWDWEHEFVTGCRRCDKSFVS